MDASNKHLYEFDSFRLDPSEHILLRHGNIIPLTPKVFETLLVLVERNGHVVDKDEILQKVWSDTFVEETNLAKNISILRKVLSENDSGGSFIETIPKRGYRFIGVVQDIETKTPKAESKSTVSAKKKVGLFASLAVLLGLLLMGVYWWFPSQSNNPKTASEIKSIAVLPFKPLGAKDEDNYLGLGIADALIIKLGQLNHLNVRPTGNVRQYADEPQVDAVSAGKKLSVEAVLEGSIQRTEDRFRVTIQLINVADGRQLWADKFEEKSTDLFALQDTIASRVAQAMTSQLTDTEQKKLARRETNNPEAFQLYVRGHFFANQETTEGFKKALDNLNRAVELDPNYALAYAALARAYHGASEWHLPPREAMPKMRFYAEKALSLDETLPEARMMLGDQKLLYEWDWAGAESDFRRALELNPNHAGTHLTYAWFLSGMGRHQEALAEAVRAEELDPLKYPCQPYYFARDYDRAITDANKILEMNPTIVGSLQWLGFAYEQKGMYEEAIAAFQKARQIEDTPDAKAYQARVLALSGKKDEARKILTELQDLSKQRYVSPFFIAVIYAGLNEKDEALKWLEKAYEDRSYWMTSLKVNPQLDNLRDDVRFQDLLRRLKFSDAF